MPIAFSKLTSQGQISVPAAVRRKLGAAPGSVLEWDWDGNRMVVQRARRYTSQDVHRALFRTPPSWRTTKELTAGIHEYTRRRHESD